METLFLASFVFGALFTLASVLLGAAGHLSGAHFHLPHLGHDLGGNAPHLPHGGDGLHLAHATHADLHIAPAHAAAGSDEASLAMAPHGTVGLPLLNASSVLAFLTWFGAAGYLVVHFAAWPALLALPIAVVVGAVGWVAVAAFLRTLLAGEREMDPWDYRLEGTIGHLTVAIPAGGTGEVVFAKEGVRRSEAARSKDGAALEHGREVVIVSYAHGVATVEPWESFVGDPANPRVLEARATDAAPEREERA